MVSSTAKIGGRIFVKAEVLQAIKSRLDGLPVKEKTTFDFKDAAMFLYSGIKNAVQKNYTKEEIQQIIVKEGWLITQNSFRYLWILFLSEDENPRKRKPYVRSVKKIRADKTNLDVGTDKSNATIKDNIAIDGASLPSEFMSAAENNGLSYKSDTNSNAHFDLPPDTEDL